MITYGYDKEQKQYLYYVYFSNRTDDDYTMVKMVLPNQRWNNIVFNYNGSNADLFVNGILERSINLSDNMPIYEISDNITVGSDLSGVNGAIININYYSKSLGAFEILGMYRLGINTIDFYNLKT